MKHYTEHWNGVTGCFVVKVDPIEVPPASRNRSGLSFPGPTVFTRIRMIFMGVLD